MGNSETNLYRHFSESDDLLYVGVSLSAVKRTGEHMRDSHWSDKISRIEISSFSTRTEALDAERDAIKTENPSFNIVHKPKETKADTRKEALGNQLVSRLVSYQPLYTLKEAGAILKMSEPTIRAMILKGEIGGVIASKHARIVNGETKFNTHYRITGWQMIEYIESLEVVAIRKS